MNAPGMARGGIDLMAAFAALEPWRAKVNARLDALKAPYASNPSAPRG